MSIRLLTENLEAEAVEIRRQQQYDVARVREPQNDPIQPEPSFLSGKGKRQEKPAETVVAPPRPRQVSLKTRKQNNPWGVPGGIAARFGQESLKYQEETEKAQTEQQEERVETPEAVVQEPVREPEEAPEETTNKETEEITQQEASEEDENPSITIELQSSH